MFSSGNTRITMQSDQIPLASYDSIDGDRRADVNSQDTSTSCSQQVSRTKCLAIVLVLMIMFSIALTTYFVTIRLSKYRWTAADSENQYSYDDKHLQGLQKDIIKNIKASNLEKNLKYFSSKPHVAGSARNNELGDEIHRRFKSFGFDSEVFEYNVLLSYPNKSNPNFAYILNGETNIQYRTKAKEDILIASEKQDDIVQPFNAFSPPGTVTGELVYANYGSENDFQMLKNHFKVDCSGKIVIVRCGGVFRGDKVKIAQENKAVGLLIYMDPAEFSPFNNKDVYPNGLWLPKDGVQRGTLKIDGDVLTPGWPATGDAYRIPKVQASLPTIPCQPISAQDAWNFMSKIGGPSVGFSNWTGGFNMTYHVGPGFRADKYNGWKVKLEVHNENKITRIKNIIGTLKGKTEPDRYVLVGNHRDAWVFGAADASSGTAVLMEAARAIAAQSKSGWRPKRTIKFCSWDSEEPGIIGSTEWVEEFAGILSERAVGYINVDTGIVGNHSLFARASPMMYDLIYKVTKLVQDPHESSISVFEKYTQSFPSKENHSIPLIESVGSGSDFLMFYQRLGIPAVDFTYAMKQVDPAADPTFYPMYHSSHETFFWMKKFVDPQFHCHRAVTSVVASAVLFLSDSSIIQYNPNDYSIALQKGIGTLEIVLRKKGAYKHGVTLDPLHKAMNLFKKAASGFAKSISRHRNNKYFYRIVNDQLIQLEKGFIHPEGVYKKQKYIKHLVFAPSAHNSYGSSAFSSVADLLFDIEDTKNWNEVKRQLTIIATAVKTVAESLKVVF